MSDHENKPTADQWVDAAAALALITIAIITFIYWAYTT